MPIAVSPAMHAFLQAMPESFTFAQAKIQSRADRFELRHVEDADLSDEQLELVSIGDLRALAQFTADHRFRPLRSAPNLRRGWRTEAFGQGELEAALDHLYPGGIADWAAAQAPVPSVTHYREFTDRQTGMYRITQKLSDPQAALAIRACCAPHLCLKRRLWTVDGLDPDDEKEKSIIPCLEPCAILLEFARRSMRIEQETPETLTLSPSDMETLQAALESAREKPPQEMREADLSAPANPRRLERVRLLLQRHTSDTRTNQTDSE